MDKAHIYGIIFDFDGTITRPFFNFDIIKDEIGMPRDMLILEFLKDKDEAFKIRARDILDRWEVEAAEKAMLNDYIPELLDFLKSRKIKTAVLTRNRKTSIEAVSRKFRLSFDYIDTRENEPIKPHPDSMKRVISRLDLEPENILTVGDFEHDILCGKNAGTLTMFLTNGKNDHDLKLTPDYIVKDMREGLKIIKNLV
jgi:HAD superfamily hydrolase (TIGR01549 family)